MKRRISKNSITSRWIINNLGVLLLILLIILASLIFGVQNYYYLHGIQIGDFSFDCFYGRVLVDGLDM